ncbi:MAG: hypothetical protein IPP71_07500 [Bacteroidetes bacterium]|nr:hypothetical protein [Bacteroidota bacterium]
MDAPWQSKPSGGLNSNTITLNTCLKGTFYPYKRLNTYRQPLYELLLLDNSSQANQGLP